ncbi:MazG nucleotide pyrophosphohydrolase domain-containing protein [Streptomyces sp. NPDC056652]|uniref:MazG nucleotide pyrophosphohydrolase domain-containing protein n=1 Tax=Streptomyces sp. NPDC056652 TaxID=3345893 RepID=UPI003675B3F0
MDLDELQRRALRIHDLYDELNLRERGRVWTREEFMLGFVGDVGDLAKLVMAEEGAREVPGGGRAALEHELADCLWSVLILAHRYDVDLDAAFLRTMDELDRSISGRRVGGRPGSDEPVSEQPVSEQPVSAPGRRDDGPG